MIERDEKILAHLGLYRLSFRRLIERRFFDQRNAGNVLQRLLKQRRIQSRPLSGRLHYYQLTEQEARARGLPAGRTQPPNTQALLAHIGMLWFATVNSSMRRRLEPRELTRLFPGNEPPGPHCLEAGDQPRVYRVWVVSPRTDHADLLRRVRQRLDQLRVTPALEAWMTNRQYGLALLTEHAERLDVIRASMNRAGIPQEIATVFETVPSPVTIGAALRQIAPVV